jgi:hypothetical protein
MMARKLKLFRTSAGFHDAYVAASSRKAALVAWGAHSDLFARGIAEEVNDAELLLEAATNPGTVLKRLRGTPEEHLATITARQKSSKKGPALSEKREASAKPRPARTELDDAERALAEHEEALKAHLDQLKAERAKIEALMTRSRKAGDVKSRHLEATVIRLRRKYDNALARWREESWEL